MPKHAIVIDGNSLLYRGYYATESQVQWALERGLQPMNAVLAMVRACETLRAENDYAYGLIAFDHWKKNFRHAQYHAYKAGRARMPDPLVSQLPIVHEALTLLGYPIQSLPTFEADDLCGSFAHRMNEAGVAVTIYTSDHDLLQLVGPLTRVVIIKKGTEGVEYNAENFADLTGGLHPNQIPDFKGLAGDSSDHLPGVPGIGKKTGQKLLHTYGSLEAIYEHQDELKGSVAQKIAVGEASARMCKELATIRQDLFDGVDLATYCFRVPQLEALKTLFERYGIANARITRSTDGGKPPQ